jgi:hypothetical protein
MNAPINRDASPATGRSYSPAMLARALGADKVRESATAPPPDVEPVIRLAVEDHKPIMNNNELATTAVCPYRDCRKPLRLRIRNPDLRPQRTSCPVCFRYFRFTVPLSALIDYDQEQAEARRSKVSNLHGVNHAN